MSDDPYWQDTAYSDDESDEERPRGSPTLKISPLDIRFTQKKMRNVFIDGKLIKDTIPHVKAVPLPKGSSIDAQWLLEFPFPAIEVVRWTCKVRDERTGRPVIDLSTGKPQLDDEGECWYTLDNRRLYCLQVAAAKLWPERCVVDVIAEVHRDRRLRELRKFRTMDSGKSILVGSRVDGVDFNRWSWQEWKKSGEKGLPSDSIPTNSPGSSLSSFGMSPSLSSSPKGDNNKGKGKRAEHAMLSNGGAITYQTDVSKGKDSRGRSDAKTFGKGTNIQQGYGQGKGFDWNWYMGQVPYNGMMMGMAYDWSWGAGYVQDWSYGKGKGKK